MMGGYRLTPENVRAFRERAHVPGAAFDGGDILLLVATIETLEDELRAQRSTSASPEKK